MTTFTTVAVAFAIFFVDCSGCLLDPDDRTQGAPGNGLLSQYVLEGDQLYPEGIAYDPVHRSFIVGSMTDGSLSTVTADGVQTAWSALDERGWGTLGLSLDADRRVLWACADNTETTALGWDAVWRIDADTGERLSTISLGSFSHCNDLVVSDAGHAYVTDPVLSQVYKVTARGEVSVVASGGPLTGIPLAGPNGIAITPDGDALIVGVLFGPRLVAVPLRDGRAPFAIRLRGDALSLLGPDGLAFHQGDLAVVLGRDVARVQLSDDLRSGRVTRLDTGLTGISTAVVAEGALYVVKSEVERFILSLPPHLPFAIEAVPGWE